MSFYECVLLLKPTLSDEESGSVGAELEAGAEAGAGVPDWLFDVLP